MVENIDTFTPGWFQKLQEKAQNEFANLPMPKLEKIKYEQWLSYSDCPTIAQSQETQLIEDENTFSVDYRENGIEVHAPKYVIDAGFEVYNLRSSQTFTETVVQDYFGQVIPPCKDKVSAYNIAQLNGGMFMIVPENLEIDIPLEITWQSFAQRMSTRFVGVIGKNTQITMIEDFTDKKMSSQQWIAMQEWIINENAHVNYAGFEHLGRDHHAYIRRHAQVKRDATLDWSISSLNHSSSVSDLQSRLIGQGASSTMATISVGTQDKVQGVNGNIVNEAPQTFGEIIQHGVVFDQATITFNGIGHILKAAKNAESQQESRLLMFSKEGRGDVNPILLIDEYEVQAGHAASMGRVDSEQLYYLMTRGLSQQEAEFLVMKGFLIHAFNDFDSDIIREKNLDLLNQALGVL